MSRPTQAGLCEGYGGLTLAVSEVLAADLVWYSEIEPAACRLLAHHHPCIPNHGDLTATDWSGVESPDILTGGWPCQPWSLAGQRKGAADERAIWPHVARAVRDLRPRLVFLENVASIASAGELARAAGDLAALGYVGSWRSVRASDVGAPHRRERIFILAELRDTDGVDRERGSPPELQRQAGSEVGSVADTSDVGHERAGRTRERRPGPADRGHAAPDADRSPLRQHPVPVPGCGGEAVAGRAGETPPDSSRVGRGEGRTEPARIVGGPDAAVRSDPAPHPDHVGLEDRDRDEHGSAAPQCSAPDVDWAGYRPAIERWERIIGRRAPTPTVLGKRGNPQLSAVFVEFLMGLPAGHVSGVPGLSRNAQLKLLGNGVVPVQAAHALRLMLTASATGRAAA